MLADHFTLMLCALLKLSVPVNAYEDLMAKQNASDDELASLRGSKG